ncbi:hypothetical protein SUGI_0627550 [Cryptomeria japonica]|nr:hypothetical protein SUGI_0627550 [Cryptomeria japonica]
MTRKVGQNKRENMLLQRRKDDCHTAQSLSHIPTEENRSRFVDMPFSAQASSPSAVVCIFPKQRINETSLQVAVFTSTGSPAGLQGRGKRCSRFVPPAPTPFALAECPHVGTFVVAIDTYVPAIGVSALALGVDALPRVVVFMDARVNGASPLSSDDAIDGDTDIKAGTAVGDVAQMVERSLSMREGGRFCSRLGVESTSGSVMALNQDRFAAWDEGFRHVLVFIPALSSFQRMLDGWGEVIGKRWFRGITVKYREEVGDPSPPQIVGDLSSDKGLDLANIMQRVVRGLGCAKNGGSHLGGSSTQENAQADGWIEVKQKKGKKGLVGSVCIPPSLEGGGVPGEVAP